MAEPLIEPDHTRTRLLEAAGEVFAEQGFQAATVRDICARAGANIAAVNYHFRDKMGLYDAVLKESLCVAGDDAPASQPDSPEQALRFTIAGMLRRMSRGMSGGVTGGITGCATGNTERGGWQARIMAHEMAQPTAGLDRVVDQIIAPKYARMREILAEIIGLPPDHDTTRLCAHSVIGQVVHYAHARPVIARVWPELTMTDDRIAQIAQHIADFSLAALRGIARPQSPANPERTS